MPVQQTAGSARATTAAVTVTTAGLLPAYLAGVLSVQLREDLGVGPSLLGQLVAVFFTASALAAFTAGALVRRLGTVPVVRLAAVIAAAAMLVIAVAADDPAVLFAALVLGGCGNGIGQPASNDLVARSVSAGRQGLAYGLKQAAIPLSTLLAGVAIPLVAIPFGWRTAFGIGAALALLIALTVPGSRRLGAAGSAAPPSEAAGPFRRAPLYVLAAGLMLGAGTGNALGSFAVATAVDSGIAPGTAGLLAAGASLAGALTRVLLGWLADRVRTRWLLVVAAQMSLGGLFFALLGTGSEALIALGVVGGYCTGWAWAGLATYAIARMHHGMAARATSITQGAAGLGGALGPLGFGAVVAAASYPVAWTATAALAVLGGLVCLLGRRLLLRERPALVEAHRRRRTAGARAA
jgi:MFS family permease